MNLANDISQYIASVKMSGKIRILVEGRDDKSHLENLLNIKIGRRKIKVDTAEAINGDCARTKKNNREKINKINSLCEPEEMYNNIYFFCDREFEYFSISTHFQDDIEPHCSVGKLHWTVGHSFENYFIDEGVISNAFCFLTSSEYKFDAIELFLEIMPDLVRVISSLTLAARDKEVCSYPMGVVKWKDFTITNRCLNFDIEGCAYRDGDTVKEGFQTCYKYYYQLALASDLDVCTKISRGHTAIVMLQRAFASCLLSVANTAEEKQTAVKHANEFANLHERQVASALCQAWLNAVVDGSFNYPVSLVSKLSS